VHIDAHQHFWRYNERDYVWMSEEHHRLMRDLLPENLKPLLEEIGFGGTVAVQARQMIEETEFLLDLAERHDWILGVVGWFDFHAGEAELDRQLERYSAKPKLKGARELIHDMPGYDYAVSDQHVHAISRLGPYGLTYDLLLKPPHIEPAIRLVKRFPEQLFVVDHIAKPDIRDGTMSPWREDIKLLARHENVFCKISGMVTECDWRQWRAAQTHPYIDVVLEAFGPKRSMIGSDWPVCTCAGAYNPVMRIVMDYVEQLSLNEQESVLGETCAEFYSLSV
jgi:L-fuconolactonase